MRTLWVRVSSFRIVSGCSALRRMCCGENVLLAWLTRVALAGASTGGGRGALTHASVEGCGGLSLDRLSRKATRSSRSVSDSRIVRGKSLARVGRSTPPIS